MPNGKKKKGHKMATHKRKKRLRKNRHKSKYAITARRFLCNLSTERGMSTHKNSLSLGGGDTSRFL